MRFSGVGEAPGLSPAKSQSKKAQRKEERRQTPGACRLTSRPTTPVDNLRLEVETDLPMKVRGVT